MRSMNGVTLVETMLVLVIMSAIILLGFQQYQVYHRQALYAQVVYNVDQLFGATAEYYQANCRKQINPQTGASSGWLTGSLDPSSNPENPFPISISSLHNAGYLDATLYNEVGINNGYFVQLNQSTPTARTSTNNGVVSTMGNVIVWKIQVAVLLNTRVVPASALLRVLGADCLSRHVGSSVIPCESAGPPPTTGQIYAVWERLPTFAAPNANTNNWISNAQVSNFNQLYTNNSVVTNQSTPQNYLCGGN